MSKKKKQSAQSQAYSIERPLPRDNFFKSTRHITQPTSMFPGGDGLQEMTDAEVESAKRSFEELADEGDAIIERK